MSAHIELQGSTFTRKQYENRFRSKSNPSGIYFKMRLREPRSSRRISYENQGVQEESVKRTKEFKKKQLSDQENDLSHKSVTCPSKEGVTSHIMVLGTCVQRHSTKISTFKVHKYQCMHETVASLYAAIETQRRIFC